MSRNETRLSPFKAALISDTGGPAASATTFYYNVGSYQGGYTPTNSFGPGPQAVSKRVQSWKPEQLLAIGDLAYNAGGSTLQDISIGQYYNNFIAPYPNRKFRKAPYTTISGQRVARGQRSWPYNLYDYPKGFPNPLNGQRGGSPDQHNRFWGALGNHDYGLAVGYSQIGLTPYRFDGKLTGPPVGESSATSLAASIDYFLPYLERPSLLGRSQRRLNLGAVDKSGNRGAYYSVSFGGSAQQPLIEFFMLDSERLTINAGFEDWNSSGQKTFNPSTGLYEDEIKSDPDFSLTYDPSDPDSPAAPGTTTDPNNGYDQYQWLAQSLDASQATWKVITGHHPIYASGRWSDTQPDDHMSNPYLQRLLEALPDGSFDAYYNGHDHFYERALESKPGGIGLGIPFITNGNSGRNLSKKIQVPYGASVYEPSAYDSKIIGNPNTKALPYLLDSGPIEAASSALAGGGSEETSGFSNGLYGYGFGATKLVAGEDYLLFQYKEAAVADPAIDNHLRGGPAAEPGFRRTKASDWIPNPGGDFNGKADLAQFKLSISDGVVTGVELLNGGNGYMTSKGGNHRVEGFNIYGNNIDALKPWKQTAQANLTFRNGRLSAIELTDGGKGYELAVQAAADNNTATSTESLKADQQIVVALNYNIDEIQYLVRDPSLYNDFYLITNSQPVLEILGKPGEQGSLKLTVEAASQKARQWLRDGLKPTSGYNGTGSQSFSSKAQAGDFIIYHQGAAIAQGSLENGHWEGTVSQLPKPTDRLVVDFAGDPITSYNVNFKPFNGKARVIASPKNTEPSSASFFREDNSQALFTSPMLSTPQPEIWQAAINPLTGDALS